MTKTICDFCKKNPGSKNFKVKRRTYKQGFFHLKRTWVYVDICSQCYEKLFSPFEQFVMPIKKEDKEVTKS
jgi:hypothetical protein